MAINNLLLYEEYILVLKYVKKKLLSKMNEQMGL